MFCRRIGHSARLAVSPELMLRPSLSGSAAGQRTELWRGGVAGAYAPAFVERDVAIAVTKHPGGCRRSLCSGLR